MKQSIIILTAFFFACTPPHSQMATSNKTEKLLLNKWIPVEYVIDEKQYPIEERRQNDFLELLPNHEKNERFHGKKVKGSWEYLPHGNFIMIYGPKKWIYVPARVVSISDEWLKIITYDVKSGKFIISVYKAGK
ncbi:MAG: hypothetical protein U9N31_03645 [Candidatus Marinimicrobia bacterium]|nr:hypothetical protein [Candidatus Neomarinimicrobiota bacterium]